MTDKPVIHERRSAGTARKIRVRLGEEAYLQYKNHGIVPPELDTAPMPTKEPKKPPEEYDDSWLHQVDGVGSDLTELRAGDILRDAEGQRIRVQKVYPDRLRVHDPKNGVREVSYEKAVELGMHLEEKTLGGPAAKRMGELRDEAERLEIDTAKLVTTKQLVEAIAAKKSEGVEGLLDQIDPMLASDKAKNLQDYAASVPWRSSAMHGAYWNNDAWGAEEKIDGVRLKLHFTSEGVRTDSRRRDARSRRFSEKSPNFPHLLAVDIPELYGTVLDSEGIVNADRGVLPSGVEFRGKLSVSTAATNAGPDVSRQIQAKFGQMHFWVFDILRHKGEDVTQRPYRERRILLQEVLEKIFKDSPEVAEFIHLTKLALGTEKLILFENILDGGGEGIIFKRLDARYKEGARPTDWVKLKKFQTVDAYVSGYVPGKAGNEKLVGALELSVMIDGKEIGVAAVSQLTGKQRLEFSDENGALKSEIYGRVVTFRGQEMTKRGRYRHAVLVEFREDKTKEQCDGYEIREDLEAFGVIPTSGESSQDTFF